MLRLPPTVTAGHHILSGSAGTHGAGCGGDRVRVYVRVRGGVALPRGPELAAGSPRAPSREATSLHVESHEALVLQSGREDGRSDARRETFVFDRIFQAGTTQREVFEDVAAPILARFQAGFDGCIMAYGQTGSGKTYTMMGAGGIVFGVAARLCDFVAATSPATSPSTSPATSPVKLKLSVLELYCEHARDLLTTQPRTPQTCTTSHRLSSQVAGSQGPSKVTVESRSEMLRLLEEGSRRRVVASTTVNEASSRSHLIVKFYLCAETGTSELTLVDLAGSERVSKTDSDGVQFNEGRKINLSLTSLGNVVSSLGGGGAHVPYRDSKLTMLLQKGLSASAAAIICTIPPTVAEHALYESLSTLRFGQRAMQIKSQVTQSQKTDTNARIRHLLDKQKELQKYISFLEQQLQMSPSLIDTSPDVSVTMSPPTNTMSPPTNAMSPLTHAMSPMLETISASLALTFLTPTPISDPGSSPDSQFFANPSNTLSTPSSLNFETETEKLLMSRVKELAENIATFQIQTIHSREIKKRLQMRVMELETSLVSARHQYENLLDLTLGDKTKSQAKKNNVFRKSMHFFSY